MVPVGGIDLSVKHLARGTKNVVAVVWLKLEKRPLRASCQGGDPLSDHVCFVAISNRSSAFVALSVTR